MNSKTRAKGQVAFSVLDITSTQNNHTLVDLKNAVADLPAVLTCDLGHFGSTIHLSRKTTAQGRLCIVNKNVRGVLGQISSVIGHQYSFNISSQRNRSHGAELASTVFDLDIGPTDGRLKEATLSLLQIDGVISADVGSFTPGSLARLREGESTGKQSSSDYYGGSSSSRGGRSDSFERRTALDVMSERNVTTISSNQLVIVMVGLPARGKSFTARKLCSFLNWGADTRTKIFNAGKYRRQVQEEKANERVNHTPTTPAPPPPPTHHSSSSSFGAAGNGSASFFSADNTDANVQREEAADRALDDIYVWFLQQPTVSSCAIFDATNSTRSRRNHIVSKFQRLEKQNNSKINFQVVFLEVICDDPIVLRENVLNKVRSSPDYVEMSLQHALSDFNTRIHNYTLQYEPIDRVLDQHLSFIQVKNLANHVVLNKVFGRITSTFVPYLMALHVGRRPLWFVCVDHLSRSNIEPVCASLYEWLRTSMWMRLQDMQHQEHQEREQEQEEKDDATTTSIATQVIPVFTSFEDLHVQLALSLDKATKTANASHASNHSIDHQVRDELRTPSKTGSEVTSTKKGTADFRMCVRLVPMVIELEQQTTPTLVIANSRCIRGLLAYFLRTTCMDQVELEHSTGTGTVVELIPTQSGSWEDTRHHL